MNKAAELSRFRSKKVGIGIVIILHIVGAAGFLSPLSDWFVFLTPVNMIITAGMIWIDSKQGNVLGWPIALTIILLGYLVEIFGVQTGLLFGNYEYGEVLGWKFFEVPPIIGVNWLVVIWGCYSFVHSFKVHKYLRWIAVGLMATLLDMLIEPVAIHFGFWQWADGIPPQQNYIAWFIISCAMALLFEKYPLVSKPRLGVVAIVCQFLFFGILLYAIS
ncbi:MAG: carotenoid biosynthesis protein [Cryomorphaceae bacterium]|nr:carotenoid biosynthesis protein [Flavobacteriales bacterium]